MGYLTLHDFLELGGSHSTQKRSHTDTMTPQGNLYLCICFNVVEINKMYISEVMVHLCSGKVVCLCKA